MTTYFKTINGVEHLATISRGVSAKTANYTVLPSDNGSIITIGTDALVMTLTSALPVGFEIMFINTGTDGNNIITISPESTAKIIGSVKRRQGTNADATTAGGLICTSGGVLDKDWINTKATSKQYDYCKLVKISDIEYFIEDGLGIWASQA